MKLKRIPRIPKPRQRCMRGGCSGTAVAVDGDKHSYEDSRKVTIGTVYRCKKCGCSYNVPPAVAP